MPDTATGNPPPRAATVANWLAVALLALVAAVLVSEVGFGVPAAHGQGGAGIERSENVFVVAGQITPDTYGIYLVDTEHHRLCMYQWLPSSRKLRLLAVRNYSYDLLLDEYNTEKLPREIKQLVEEGRPLTD